ncbi:MAG TPA: type II secretion system protein GspJ [Thermodesulfovibrionales bacterium]|nr:type II secretion system protein GspJ [Thermodesulfovibrionales bacterium]
MKSPQLGGAGAFRMGLSTARCGDQGFTLLEVLVALGISAIIMTALYSAFFLSRKAVDAVDDSLLRLQESRALLDIIKREMESALYESVKPYTLFKLEDRDYYGKQASRVSFTSFSPLIPGLAKIGYSVEEGDGKLVLKKSIGSAFAKTGEPKSIELMEDVESFTVEARYGDKWVKTWDSAESNSMPEEIRVSVKVYTKKGETPFMVYDVARPRYGKPL